MKFTELKAEFIEASGRYDLSDGEILKFLNRGSRLLDRRSLRDKIESRAHASLQPGSFVLTTDPDLRSIKAVYAATADKRSRLEPESLERLRSLYDTRPVYVANGPVLAYAQTSVTIGPGGQTDGLNPNSDFWAQWADDLLANNTDGYRGLVVYPPPEAVTVIEVIGNYYTPAIRDEELYDSNWWSSNHPQLLIQAALVSIDTNYRNTMGAKENFAMIDEELRQIFYDDIEDTFSRNSRMEG